MLYVTQEADAVVLHVTNHASFASGMLTCTATTAQCLCKGLMSQIHPLIKSYVHYFFFPVYDQNNVLIL